MAIRATFTVGLLIFVCGEAGEIIRSLHPPCVVQLEICNEEASPQFHAYDSNLFIAAIGGS